jgi:agmatine deiminase
VKKMQTPGLRPVDLGYRMPAEWEPHEATWLAWPHKLASWPGKFEPIPDVYARIVAALSPVERVRICVSGPEMEGEAREVLARNNALSDSVEFFHIPTNDAWIRDTGPIFVTRKGSGDNGRGPVAVVDWLFNSWGGKYPPFDQDDVVPQRVAEALRLPLWEPGIVMEGGSIDVNGCGTLLTTESCLLNPNRNPHLTRQEIEEFLGAYLSVRKVLWLGEGIVGDDTDGHVDDITRFVGPSTVVTVVEDKKDDENHEPLQKNLALLKTMTDQDGRPLKVVTLPMPAPVEFEGERLPASYANFYIANKVVLLPVFNCAADKLAIETMQRVLPDRRVIPIDCTDLVLGLGAIHCASQQQPAV